jgi:signal transduction histidine kinase
MGRISHQLLRTRFPKPFAEIEKEMLTHDRWEGELVHTRRDGGEITVSSRWAMRRDAGGQPSGFLEINTDITARKRFEEQLRETQSLESLGVLAGGIAHDFNNLLTGILGNATLALTDLSPSSPVRSMLQHVVHGSERAATLIRQLLAYSGRGRFVVEPVSLSEVVEEIAELVRLSIPKTIQLHLHLAENLPAIEDAVQPQQLIMNLVINGAEAIEEDKSGTLSVATGTQEVDANYIQTTLASAEIQPGMYVALEVQDTGQGMDQVTIGKIFDPFFTTKFTGRGLGLAAVLGIVRGHKAAIKVYSVPGQGTTLKVLFPAAAQPARAGKMETPAANLAGSGMVLVVDDEEIVRSPAGQTLDRYGYTVLMASNGQEAVNLFRDHAGEICVVLLDLTMPVMSGEETLRHMQAIRGDVRVILPAAITKWKRWSELRTKPWRASSRSPIPPPRWPRE